MPLVIAFVPFKCFTVEIYSFHALVPLLFQKRGIHAYMPAIQSSHEATDWGKKEQITDIIYSYEIRKLISYIYKIMNAGVAQ